MRIKKNLEIGQTLFEDSNEDESEDTEDQFSYTIPSIRFPGHDKAGGVIEAPSLFRTKTNKILQTRIGLKKVQKPGFHFNIIKKRR